MALPTLRHRDADLARPGRELAVVTVNYRSHALLRQNLRPLSLRLPELRVVVVDNLSDQAERVAVGALCAELGWALVTLPTNAGFGAGVNAGAAAALASGAERLLLLNPDAAIEPDSVALLEQAVREDPWRLVSPVVRTSTGQVWFDGMDLDLRTGLSRASRKRAADADPADFMPWISAAALMVDRRLWTALGGFAEDFFLYWEDVDLSRRATDLGAGLHVERAAAAVHDQGGTHGGRAAGRGKSNLYYFYNIRNRLLFAESHLDPAQRAQWRRTAPAAARAVLLQGGRRQFVRPVGPLTAALRGSVAGLRRTTGPRVAERPIGEHARLYSTVRTAHLERAREWEPATLVYRHRRYDFDTGVASGLDLVQAGPLAALALLARARVRTVEVNEPLDLRGLSYSAVVLAGLDALARLRGRPRPRVVSYAIGNADPFRVPRGASARTRVRRRLERPLARAVANRIDRLCFGTSAAAQTYAEILGGPLPAETALVPALPAPCTCEERPRQAERVLFLGAFSSRKGVDRVLAAWPELVARRPGATLHLVGKGALVDEVTAFARPRPEVSVEIDPPREVVHTRLREATVVVLLSQPGAVWREQVGLPLVEGLAHGCRVVATTETGIADWLAEHGHTVLRPDAEDREIAAAIDLQVRRAAVPGPGPQHDLPAVDGRALADQWLFGGEAAP